MRTKVLALGLLMALVAALTAGPTDGARAPDPTPRGPATAETAAEPAVGTSPRGGGTDFEYTVLWAFDCNNNYCVGVTPVQDTLVWVSSGGRSGTADPNIMYIFDVRTHALVDSFDQFVTTAWGYRDMAYDPSTDVVYAGTDSRRLDLIDATNHTLISTHTVSPGPSVIRGMGFDGDSLYSGDFTSSPVYKFATDGTNSHTVAPIPPKALYGIAIDVPGGRAYATTADYTYILIEYAFPTWAVIDTPYISEIEIFGGAEMWQGSKLILLAQAARDSVFCFQIGPAGPRHDVAMGSVLAPGPLVNPAEPVAPLVVVYNNGTYDETDVPVHCRIDSAGTQIYLRQQTIAQLDSASQDTVEFPAWEAGPSRNIYELTFWHEYSPDTNRANDTVESRTRTRFHDVRAAGMNIAGRVRAGATVTPMLTLASGDYTERDFWAYCLIDSAGTTVYEDSVAVDSIGSNSTHGFPFPSDWQVGPVGATYFVTMWHELSGDEDPANDTLAAATEAVDQIRVLWCYSDYAEPETTLGRRLRALGDSIEYLDVQNSTPTLSQLLPYDAVGCHSNYVYADSGAFGNVLADYVDAGGGVVIGHFSFSTGWGLGGRVMGGSYATITKGANTHLATTLGWYNAGHPIMDGVTSVGAYYAGGSRFVTTAESVARWQDGRPYVGVSANQKVVGVNSYPGVANRPERTGDWALVYHNALQFVVGGVGVRELDPFVPALDVRFEAVPSPARERVVVSYAVAGQEVVSIGIYDLSGRLVRTLVRGRVPSGVNTAVWDMTDDSGRRAGAGAYFCRLVAGDKTRTVKLVVD